jgi:hypothetical protein
MQMLGYKFPEQQTSEHWLEIEKILDQIYLRGFNAGQALERQNRLDDERFGDEHG